MKHCKLLRSAAVLLTALVWCFSLAGCGFRYVLENDNYAKDEVQRLLTALDRGDQQGFKDLFCEDSVKKINEIDRKTDEFFRFYQGRSVSWEDLGGSSEKRMGSGRYLTFRYPCSVVTSQETYRILFYYTAYHEDEPDQVGLHSILIMTEALAQEAEIWQWPEENEIEVLYTLGDCDIP